MQCALPLISSKDTICLDMDTPKPKPVKRGTKYWFCFRDPVQPGVLAIELLYTSETSADSSDGHQHLVLLVTGEEFTGDQAWDRFTEAVYTFASAESGHRYDRSVSASDKWSFVTQAWEGEREHVRLGHPDWALERARCELREADLAGAADRCSVLERRIREIMKKYTVQAA